MADIERTKTELLAIFADGQPIGSINPQDMRDYVVTTDIVNTRFSTGLITGGEVIINSGDDTKVDIADGSGFYTDNTTDPLNPIRLKVSWTGLTAITLPDLATEPLTFIGLDLSSGEAVVVFQPANYTPEERRDIVTLATAVHTGMTVIENIATNYSFALDLQQTVTDLSISLLSINIGRGNVYGANAGANLNMDKSAGSTFNIGGNYDISKKSPNISTDLLQSPVPFFFYTFQNGSGGFTNGPIVTTINPEQWDDGSGNLATVSNNQFTTQRLWFFPQSGPLTVIHYGQTEYASIEAAQADLNTEDFNENPDLILGFRAWLIIKKGTTDLNSASEVKFIAAGRFGDVLRS